MKIVTILGARPQFVKAAALSRSLRMTPGMQEVIVHTGQHYDANMSDVFFEQMKIPKPDFFLGVTSKLHGEMTARMMEGIEKILIDQQPDLVLVYGDTNSTLAGALSAKKLHIRIAHVEAGLRSFNMKMPEEVNRILTDRVSDFLFCPGEQARTNLRNEGFDNFDCQVHNVGDIMKDVAYFYKDHELKPSFDLPSKFVLSTIHRAENTDNEGRLKSILEGLRRIGLDLPVVLPLHPRTAARLKAAQLAVPRNVMIVDPVGYLEMVYLLKRCALVVTDSGGLQKEAYFFGRGCITTREETEWSELVSSGFNKVVGADPDRMEEAKNRFRDHPLAFNDALYGDGNTAAKITGILQQQIR